MHTVEEAKVLWCPMSRVAQAGQTDISAAYNRSLNKTLKQVEVASVDSHEDIARGVDPANTHHELMLEVTPSLSRASSCVADGCAMWRWVDPKHSTTQNRRGYCGLAGAQVLARPE